MKSNFVLLLGTLISTSVFAAQEATPEIHQIITSPVEATAPVFTDMNSESCKPKALSMKDLDLTVSDYFSRNKQSDFENLRSSPEYKRDGRNIMGVIPNKSILKVVEATNDKYVKVQIVSVAKIDESKLKGNVLLEVGDEAFIHIGSLKSILDYSIKFEGSEPSLSEGSLNFNKSGSSKLAGVECCTGETCTSMFTLKNTETGDQFSVEDENSLFFSNTSLIERKESIELEVSAEGKVEETKEVSGVPAVSGFREKVVCTPQGGDVNVYSSDKKVTGQKENGSSVRLYQGEDAREFKIDSRTYTKILVDGDRAPVWIFKDMIDDKQNCESLKRQNFVKVYACTTSGGELNLRNASSDMTEITDKAKAVDSGKELSLIKNHQPKEIYKTLGGIKYKFRPLKIDDKTLWAPDRFLSTGRCQSSGSTLGSMVFPTPRRPKANYYQGMRRYGAGRSGGSRLHAANDLYTRSIYFKNGRQKYHRSKERKQFGSDYNGGRFRAIATGKVIRQMHEFYLNTSEMAIKDSAGGKVWRYGEVYHNTKLRDGRRIKKGMTIRKGTDLGKIKWVGIGSVPPMLHLERYRSRNGVHNGVLRKLGRYKRPAGHYNPTQEVKSLEKRTFGRSW